MPSKGVRELRRDTSMQIKVINEELGERKEWVRDDHAPPY